jgi:uncharacterized protein
VPILHLAGKASSRCRPVNSALGATKKTWAASIHLHCESTLEVRMSAGDWKEMFNAACEGNLTLLEYHVRSGADVNYAHPEFLGTPLVASILAGQEAVALFLLQNGANPSLWSEFDGATPIQAAMKMKMERVESRLLQLGAIKPQVPANSRSLLQRLWGKGGA